MKTLTEQIEEIKASKMTFTAKKAAIVSLGIMGYEADLLLAGSRPAHTTPRIPSYTFGVEIECGVPAGRFRSAAYANGVTYQYEGYNHNDGQAHFKMVSDGSLRIDDAIECVSPILKGADGKKRLKAVCKSLNEAGASVNRTCGLHVHIGASDLTDEQYANVFINYYYLEGVIDRFMSVSRRGNNNTYCRSLHYYDTNLASFTSREDIRRYFVGQAGSCARYHKVNPVSYQRHGTIEFRQHQGTTNFDKIMNWVVFCGKLVQWSKTNVLSEHIESIDDIPFLTKKEKDYFKSRAERVA